MFHVQALSLMWPELLEPIDGAVTPSSVRFRMTLRAGNGEAVVSVDDIARMDMRHLHATMFTHLRALHFLIRACAGARPRALQGAHHECSETGTAHSRELHILLAYSLCCVARVWNFAACGLQSCAGASTLWGPGLPVPLHFS